MRDALSHSFTCTHKRLQLQAQTHKSTGVTNKSTGVTNDVRTITSSGAHRRPNTSSHATHLPRWRSRSARALLRCALADLDGRSAHLDGRSIRSARSADAAAELLGAMSTNGKCSNRFVRNYRLNTVRVLQSKSSINESYNNDQYQVLSYEK